MRSFVPFQNTCSIMSSSSTAASKRSMYLLFPIIENNRRMFENRCPECWHSMILNPLLFSEKHYSRRREKAVVRSLFVMIHCYTCKHDEDTEKKNNRACFDVNGICSKHRIGYIKVLASALHTYTSSFTFTLNRTYSLRTMFGKTLISLLIFIFMGDGQRKFAASTGSGPPPSHPKDIGAASTGSEPPPLHPKDVGAASTGSERTPSHPKDVEASSPATNESMSTYYNWFRQGIRRWPWRIHCWWISENIKSIPRSLSSELVIKILERIIPTSDTPNRTNLHSFSSIGTRRRRAK